MRHHFWVTQPIFYSKYKFYNAVIERAQYPLQILKGCPKGGVVYIEITNYQLQITNLMKSIKQIEINGVNIPTRYVASLPFNLNSV